MTKLRKIKVTHGGATYYYLPEFDEVRLGGDFMLCERGLNPEVWDAIKEKALGYQKSARGV